MKITLLAATAALSLAAATAAHAGECNDDDPFPFRATGAVVATVPTQDTGSERPPSAAFAYLPIAVVEGDVLPTNGGEGIVQTANILPHGALDGVVAYAQALPVLQRYLLQAQDVTPPQAQRLVRPAVSSPNHNDVGGGRVRSATAAALPAVVACPPPPDPAAEAERAANLVRARLAAEAGR